MAAFLTDRDSKKSIAQAMLFLQLLSMIHSGICHMKYSLRYHMFFM